jgi:cytoplasmic tRNA 2-thiolation protein 1
MDRIVATIGQKNNCKLSLVNSSIDDINVYALGTFCGVFRRQALDRGAALLGVNHIVTGHNADDVAETVLMNSECR